MKFLWKIENFCNLKGGTLQSPSFSSHSTMWELIVHPSPGAAEGTIIVELQQLGTLDIDLNCSFALLDFEGLPYVWEEGRILRILEYYGCETPNLRVPNVIVHLKKKIDIFSSRKTEFQPNDVLTIQCSIWRLAERLTGDISIFARSRVESAKVVKQFDWNIPETSLFQENSILEHIEPIMDGEFLNIKLFSNKENSFQVECKVSMFRCKMEVKILLLDAMKVKKIQFLNDKHHFTANGKVWTFNTKISRNMILSHPNLFLSDNTITLHFICIFSENVTFNRRVAENEFFNIPMVNASLNQPSEASASIVKPEKNHPTGSKPPNTISQALTDMFQEGFLSDFNLRIGERVFPVHRSILGMRSQVFRAMVTSEMKEKADNCVDIPDVDEDTLQRLLRFVYTDKFDEGMGWEGAFSLYTAADKYALEPLKRGCSEILKSGFSVSNILEVLLLADMHHDDNLKSAAVDFISLNDKEIFGSDLWSTFEGKHATLALDTFRNLYFKKMND